MTPKFDNLASLLMEAEEPRRYHSSNPIPDVTRREIGDYVVDHPEVELLDIAAHFGINVGTLVIITRELGIMRGHNGRAFFGGTPDDIRQAIADDLRDREDPAYMIARRHGVSKSTVNKIASQLGLSRPLGPRPMKRTSDKQKKQHATNPTGIPTVKPQQFKGSASTTTSNPKHNPRQPPTPPMDQDKQL
jgi:hypothetical protein